MNSLNPKFFIIENKELTLSGLLHVRDALKIVYENVKNLNENRSNKKYDTKKTCQVTLAKLTFLVQTLKNDKDFSLAKDLDYLYKHCIFCVLRIRDHNDYAFIDGCINVLTEVTEGWDRLSAAVANYPSEK
tara:strand:- start:242 stop:634 length:393 start_codon:yes stop_codon:yes gene_type:complete